MTVAWTTRMPRARRWLAARARERSTWLGLALVAAAMTAPHLGLAYADLKDGALVLFGLASVGGGLAAHPEGR